MSEWAKDWDNPEDAVYDKVKMQVIAAKEKSEESIREDERSRIIKLLEERYAENVDHCEWGTHLFLDNAIALIKGEK